jgi:hypothetical protein
MAGQQLAARGTMTAAPPPSVTESQRRLLADPYRLEGEGEVAWTPPAVRNPASVKRVVHELERGLAPTRPIYLKWICDKLSALPTQASNGLNAALWADNVIDTCAHYPEDLLQAATLEVLRTKTFRPSPAEIVGIIDPRYRERQRMLDRARSLLAPIAAAEQPFVQDPLDVRLRTMRDSFRRIGNMAKAAKYETDLAAHEGRSPEDWAKAAYAASADMGIPASAERPPFKPDTSPSAQRCAELARERRMQPPVHDEEAL